MGIALKETRKCYVSGQGYIGTLHHYVRCHKIMEKYLWNL